MIKDLIYLAPEITLLLINMVMMVSKNNRLFSVVCLVGVILVSSINFSHQQEVALFSKMLLSNSMVEFTKILIMAVGTIVLLMINPQDYSDEIPVLMIFAIIGTMIVASANNLLILYLGMELQALPSYVLAAIGCSKKQDSGAEAGMKYFVLGSIASGIMLYGISVVYGQHGSTDLSAHHMVNNIWLNAGMILVISGMAFKIAMAPFHLWLPDVYQGSSTIAGAFFATVPKIGLLLALNRIMQVGLLPELLKTIILVLAMLSVLTSALGGLAQKNIKRLVAYSAIGHLGYIVLGIYTQAFDVALAYLLVYTVSALGIFAFLLAINRYEIGGLAGLARSHPLAAFGFAVILLSAAGLPPLAGFFVKFQTIKSLVEIGIIWPCALVLVGSAISAYYYAAVIKVMYFDEPKQPATKLSFDSVECCSSSAALGYVMTFAVVANLTFFLFRGWIAEFLAEIAVIH